jgi:hypothetical protein
VTTAATTTSNGDQSDPSTSAEFKGLEPLAPIHSHEALDLETHTERDSHDHDHDHEHDSSPSEHSPSFSAPWSPVSPTVTLDRSPSDQAMLGPGEQFQFQFPPSRRSSSRFDRIHWKYAKFAFLCTIVLFITWVCSTRYTVIFSVCLSACALANYCTCLFSHPANTRGASHGV